MDPFAVSKICACVKAEHSSALHLERPNSLFMKQKRLFHQERDRFESLLDISDLL